jgi:acyl-coenzyme A thioesterase PaaI-like protein
VSEEMEQEIDDEMEAQEKSGVELYDLDNDTIRIRTTTELDSIYSGHIDSITSEKAVISLVTSKFMVADRDEMVHSGFISSAAEYAALIVVNEPSGMIFAVNSQYYACMRLGEELELTATVRHTDHRKRDIEVIGMMGSIKIYEGKITVIIPDYHPLKIQLLDVAGAKD